MDKRTRGIAIGAVFVFVAILLVLFLRPDSGKVVVEDAPVKEARTRVTAGAEGSALVSAPAPAVPVAATPAAPAPSKGALKVFGTVTSAADEKPVAEAEVTLHSQAAGTLRNPLFRTKTNAEGGFEFHVERAQFPSAGLMIAATASGLESVAEPLADAWPGANEPIEKNLRLGPGGRISGFVLNKEGNRLPGAVVGKLLRDRQPQSPIFDPYQVFPSVESGPDGTFEITGLPTSGVIRLYVKKRGFLPHYTPPIEIGASNVEVVLEDGEAVIRGYVEASDGKRLPKVPVRAMHRQEGPGFRPPSASFPNLEEQFTLTNDEGYYEFDALESGWQNVVADLETPLPQSVGDSVLLQLNEEKSLTLRFTPLMQMKGIVVDAATQQPISGVRVAKPGPMEIAPKAASAPSGEVVTGADGRFVVETARRQMMGFYTVPPVFYKLPPSFGIDAEKWEMARVDMGRIEADQELKIEVRRGIALEGIIYGPDGETPASGVGVDFVSFGRGQGFPRIPMENAKDAESVTGVDGRFRLRVIPGTRGAIYARTDNAMAYSMAEIPADTPPAEQKLVLQEFVSVAGVVTDPAGQPLPGVEITFFQMSNRAALMGGERTITDANGRYLKERLTVDNVRITPMPLPDSDLIPPPAQQVQLEVGKNLTDINFQFQKGAAFEGIVLDDANQPVPGATVQRQARAGWGGGRMGRGGPFGGAATTPPAETGPDGRFSLLLPPDVQTFSISVSHPSYDTKGVNDLTLEDSPLTIRLPKRSEIALTAWLADGAQLTTFEYDISLQRGSLAEGKRRNVDGKVFNQTEPVSEVLSPGTWRAHIYQLNEEQKRTGLYGFSEFELSEDDAGVEVRVTMNEPITVRGIVVNGEDKPLEGVQVTMVNRDEGRGGWGGWGGPGGGGGQGQSRTTTAADGRFTFTYATPGNVRITGQLSGHVQEKDVDLTLKAGEKPDEVTIKLLQGSTIYGIVTDHEGRPMAEANLFRNDRRGRGVRTDSEGKYEFTNVEPGEQTIIVTSVSGSEVKRESTRVGGAERKELNITLEGMVRVSGTVSRNGSRMNSDWYTLRLLPEEGAGREASIVSRRGEYEAFLVPGTYQVAVGTGSTASRTGFTFTVDPDESEQKVDIDLELYSVGIVIVTPDGEPFSPGQVRYRHRRQRGEAVSRDVRADKPRFFIEDEPAGEARAQYRDSAGREYMSIWTPIGEGEENIITLLPEELTGGN